MTVPDWLARRECTMKLGPDGKTWYVLVNCEPNYSIQAVPADGTRHAPVVRQTINGKRIECAGTYATPDEALQGGLNDLGKALGWA
jgi:hypothetical protein